MMLSVDALVYWCDADGGSIMGGGAAVDGSSVVGPLC